MAKEISSALLTIWHLCRMENSEKSIAKAPQSQLYCWQQTGNFSRRSNRILRWNKQGLCNVGRYNFLVSQTMRPIAKSLPKTPYFIESTIFEHRIGFLWGKITYTKHSRSVFMLGTKFSGNTNSTTYLSTPSVFHTINDFGGNHNTSENHS